MDEINQSRTSRGWLIILVSVTLVLVVLTTALVFLLVVNKFTVEIRINGPETVTMEYGDVYEDAGATAVVYGSLVFTEGFPLEVRTDGQVPALCLGQYAITYSASAGPWSGTAVRQVMVVDTQPPVITLFTNSAVYTRPGQAYREEGYLAVDNYDGDITDLVEVIEGNGTVTYTAADSSGNISRVTRQIRYSAAE